MNEVNKNISMLGLTEPVMSPSLVAQGDMFSPIEAVVQVDSMTRKLEQEDRNREEEGAFGILFRYTGIVPIPILGLMDDNITVAEAGFKAEPMNIFMKSSVQYKEI